ncbi:MAG: HAD family hydrolase [Acidimicrobiales bacterium]
MAGRQLQSNDGLLPVHDFRPGRLALFDLDRTLLRGSSLVALGHALVGAGVARRRDLLGAAVRDARFRRRGSTNGAVEDVRDRALGAIVGIERGPLVALAADVADELVGSMAPGARMLLDHHLLAGDFCVILSASPHELVEAVSARLGAHRGIGTVGEVVDGRYTGSLDGPFCYGPGKIERLRDALGPVDLLLAWAYADSCSDLPVLEACGHPVAVNPDRGLRTVARARRWPIVRVA